MQWRDDLDQLQQEANDLEQYLVTPLAALAESNRMALPSWREVQKVLGTDEATVELVRFDINNGLR